MLSSSRYPSQTIARAGLKVKSRLFDQVESGMRQRSALHTGNDDLKMIELSSLISNAKVGPSHVSNQYQTGPSDAPCAAHPTGANKIKRRTSRGRIMSEPP